MSPEIIADIHPDDAYFTRKKELIGKRIIRKDIGKKHDDGFISGAFELEDDYQRKRIFYKVKIKKAANASHKTLEKTEE